MEIWKLLFSKSIPVTSGDLKDNDLPHMFSWHIFVLPFLFKTQLLPIQYAYWLKQHRLKLVSWHHETPGVLIDFLTLVQRGLHAQVTTVRTDKGTEFLNKSLHAYLQNNGIRHERQLLRTPEQNALSKDESVPWFSCSRTMLRTANVPLFFWAEAIAT
ncbi:putative ribonuclease H-like domain-containing protein [Tanacetum coccineum]